MGHLNLYSIAVAGPQAGIPPGSGFGITIPGYFAGMNAKFGFNESPHTFDIDVVQDNFGGSLDTLPEIGTSVKFYIGPDYFTVSGRVTHVEYSDTMSGTTATISLQDRRLDFDNVSIFTEDQGNLSDLDERGILSVGSYLRESVSASLTSEDRRYVKNNEEGALYEDIRNTIINSPYVSGMGFKPENLFPESNIVESNLPITASGLNVSLDLFRWKFNGSSLRSVLTTVLNDLGFDWYWLLEGERIAIVNRAVDFQITEDNIPIPDSSGYTTSVRWGIDDTDADETVGLLGARQEGFIDSDLLSPIDGLPTPSGINFVKAWGNLTVGFYDSAGIYRTYIPPERELPLAMKGFDYWSVFKKHQTTLGFEPDAGFLAAQDPNFQSRIDDKFMDQTIIDLIVSGGDITAGFPTLGGIQTNLDSLSNTNKALVLEQVALTNYYSGKKYIPSKKSQNQNWMMEWYEKIKNIADNFYGRVYVAEGILINKEHGLFATSDKSWAGLENQLPAGKSFGRNYAIDGQYQPLTPFIGEDFRVSAYAVLPSYTAYGKDGSEAPDEFDRWNIDAANGHHYVPVTLMTVDNFTKDPRAAASPFLTYNPGTVICQFGKIPGEALLKDQSLSANSFLDGIFKENINAQIDFLDPTYLIKPYEYFDGSITVPGHPLSTNGILPTVDVGRNHGFDEHNVQNMSLASLPGGSGIIAYETITTSLTSSDSVTCKNLCLSSNDFSTSKWFDVRHGAGVGTPTKTKQYGCPFGAPFEATLIKNNDAVTGDGISHFDPNNAVNPTTTEIEPGKKYTVSLYIKAGDPTLALQSTIEIQVITQGGSTGVYQVRAHLTGGGAPLFLTDFGPNSVTLHPVETIGISSGGTAGIWQPWYRIAFTIDNVDDTTLGIWRIFPFSTAITPPRLDSMLIYGLQIEEVVSGNVIDYPSVYLGHTESVAKSFTGTQAFADGYSVAVSSDGTTMVVGAPMTAISGTIKSAGAVYVYEKINDDWNLLQTLYAPSSQAYEHFGFSVDIDGDGDVVIVGAPGFLNPALDPSTVGRGYIWEKAGGSFVSTVVLDDTTFAVSSGKGGQLGWSVAIDDSGERVVLGVPFRRQSSHNDKYGGFSFFRKVSGVWTEKGGGGQMHGHYFSTPANPTLYYKFNDGGGTNWTSGGGPRQCLDAPKASVAANSNFYGDLVNGPTWVSNGGVSGPTCHSLHFDRLLQHYVQVEWEYGAGNLRTLSGVNSETDYTWSAWFKCDNLISGQYYTIAGYGDYCNGQCRNMIIREDGVGNWRLAIFTVDMGSGQPYIVYGTTLIQPGIWYHGAVTAFQTSGSRGPNPGLTWVATAKVYLNGTLENTGNLEHWPMEGSPDGNTPDTWGGTGWPCDKGPRMRIGSASDNGNVRDLFDGQISDVALWNSVQTNARIEELYNKGVMADDSEKQFGYSIDISPIGDQVIVGTKYSDQVVVLDMHGATPATESFALVANNYHHIINPPGFDTTINPARGYSATWGTSTGHGNAVAISDGSSTPEVTNLLIQSNTFTTSPWAGTGTPDLTQGETDPFGGNQGWSIEDNDSGTNQGELVYRQLTPITTNVPYTFSFFVKQPAGSSATTQASFACIFTTGGTSIPSKISIIFSSTGVPTLQLGTSVGVIAPYIIHPPVAVGQGWYRLAASWSAAQVGFNTKVTIQIIPADELHNSVVKTGKLLIYGTQFEEGLYPNGNIFLDGVLLESSPGYVGHTTSGTLTRPALTLPSRIVVGAPYESLSVTHDHKGAAYIYDFNVAEDKWELFDKIYDIDGANNSNFGHSVSISIGGKIVVVGQPGEDKGTLLRAGAIQVWGEQADRFMLNKKLFSESSIENNYYGRAVDINVDSSAVVIGSGPWEAPCDGFRHPGEQPNAYVGTPTTLTLAIPTSSATPSSQYGKSLGGWNDEIPASYANVTEFRGKLLNFKQDVFAPTYWGDEYIFHKGPINCLDIERLYDNTAGSGVFVLGYGPIASDIHALLGKVENDTISVLGTSTASPDFLNSEVGSTFGSGAREISVSRFLSNSPVTATGEFVVAYKNSLGNFLNIAGSGYNNLSSIQWGGGDEPGGTFRTGGYGIATSLPVIDIDSTELRSDTFINIHGSEWRDTIFYDPAGVGTSSTIPENDFGISVQINDAGNTAMVGAPKDDAQGVSGAGSTYVYKKDHSLWEYNITLFNGLGSNTNGNFGASCDINSNGTRAAIGSPDSNLVSGTPGGSISVYNQSGDWSLDAVVMSSAPSQHERVGQGISMSSDGNHIISIFNVTGAAYWGWYHWDRTTVPGSWTQITKYNLPVALDMYPNALKISGDGLIVLMLGALPPSFGELLVFTRPNLTSSFTSSPQSQINFHPGFVGSLNANEAFIDCSYDGSILAIGAPATSTNEGKVFIYKKTLSTSTAGYDLFQTLSSPTKSTTGRFGESVWISLSGDTVIASSRESGISKPGHVSTYKLDGGRYTLEGTFIEKIKPGDGTLSRVGRYGSPISASSNTGDIIVSSVYKTDPGDLSSTSNIYSAINFYDNYPSVSSVRSSGVISTLSSEASVAPATTAGMPFTYGSGLVLDSGYSSSVSIDRVANLNVIAAYNLGIAGTSLYDGKIDLLGVDPVLGEITSIDNDTFTSTDPVGVSVTSIDFTKIEVAYLSNLLGIVKIKSIRNMDNLSLISNDKETVLGTSISPFISKYNNSIDIESFEGGIFGVLYNDGDNTQHNHPASLTIGEAKLENPLRFVVFIDPTSDDIAIPEGLANYNDLVELYETIHNEISDDDVTRWTGKIAIPVQSVRRYGESYPESWVSDANTVTNLLLYSNEFDNTASWQVFGLLNNPTIVQNETDPFSGLSAWTLEDIFAAYNVGGAWIEQQGLLSASNSSYTFSLFVKQGTSPISYFNFIPTGGQSVLATGYNLIWTSGEPVISPDTATPPGVDPDHIIHDPVGVGAGWFRVAITHSSLYLADNTNFSLQIHPAGPLQSAVGSLIVYGAQLEKGVQPNGSAASDALLLLSAPGYVGHTTNEIMIKFPGVFKKTINIDENFAPWNFAPRGEIQSESYTGPGTSVELMNFYAKNLIRSRANRFGKTRFASITKTGLPEVSFDDFALQEFATSGVASGLYGVPNHGISDLGVQFGAGGYQTSYGLKSHFAEFGRPAPLGTDKRLPFGNIIKPFRFDIMNLPPMNDGSGREFFRTLPPVISIENGNLIIEDTNKGGGVDDVGIPINTAVPDNLTTFMYPLENAGALLVGVADELDNKGNVKIRKIYHWTQDNLSDWTAYNDPNFIINTAGNGYLYIDMIVGPTIPDQQLRYIAKDNIGENTEVPPRRIMACSLDMSIVAQQDYWAGIILRSSDGHSAFFAVGTGSAQYLQGRYELVLRFYDNDSNLFSEFFIHAIEPMGKGIQLGAFRIDATRTAFHYSTDGTRWVYVGELQVDPSVGPTTQYGTGNFSQPGTPWNDLDRMGIGYDWEGWGAGGGGGSEYGAVSFDWVAHT